MTPPAPSPIRRTVELTELQTSAPAPGFSPDFSALRFGAQNERAEMTPHELDEVVERVIDKIEQRVIDELERRGRRFTPGVF